MNRLLSIILASCALFSFVGCKSNEMEYEKIESGVQMGSSFNDEVYVWENFLFNTNSTSRTLRK